MTRRVRSSVVSPGVALGCLLLSATAFAQPPGPSPNPLEIVYSTNTSNKLILKLDFATGSSTIVNTDAAQRKRLEGIAVRDDGSSLSLIVCDNLSHQILFYANATGAGQEIAKIQSPHSISLDQSGNAYVVSATRREVWKLPRGGPQPGDYGTPVLVDKILSSTLLKEAKLAPFGGAGFQSGDLLVLSRKPALLYRLPADPQSPTGFGPRQTLIPSSAFPAGTELTGFAFAPNQEFLFAALAGRIFRFDPLGQAVQPDFASGLGKGLHKIAVGVQDGASYAFVTIQRASSGGGIQRLLINPNGTGSGSGEVASQVKVPWGVGLASAQAAPTPAGGCLTGPPACPGVTVTPAPEATLVFDNVTTSGITSARVIEFEDNRGALNAGNFFVDQSLKDFFAAADPLRAQLSDVIVPAHVQAFRKGDPDTGTPTFLLTILDTTATFARTVEVEYDEADQLGYQPSCTDPDLTRQPRTFYAPEIDAPKSEPGIVEGAVFVNFTTGCGSNIGRGSRFSMWLTGQDADDPADTADSQLANASAALAFYSCIEAGTKALLEAELQAAVSAFADFKGSGDPADRDAALAALDAFIAIVDANPGAFADCDASLNVGGELIARAEAIQFSIGKVVVAPLTGNVGYYDLVLNQGNPSQVGPITAAGLQAVNVGDLQAADLSQLGILFVQNPSNGSYASTFTNNLSKVHQFVQNGGVLVFHDRNVAQGPSAASVLPGSAGSFFVEFGTDIDIVDNSTPVTNGPGGVITNTSLDGGNFSSHGYVLASSTPAGAAGILSTADPTRLTTYSYPFGSGHVVYSTIPLDFYLAGNGNNPPRASMINYAANVLAYAQSLRE